MKDKYYTPLIEEFRVGFRYEKNEPHRVYYKQDSPVEYKWSKKIWDEKQDRIGTMRCKIQEGLIRVAYLSEEDILSLGFVKTNEYKSSTEYTLIKQECIYNLLLWTTGGISVNKKINNYETDLFRGQVKNINELEVILKQVGI